MDGRVQLDADSVATDSVAVWAARQHLETLSRAVGKPVEIVGQPVPAGVTDLPRGRNAHVTPGCLHGDNAVATGLARPRL